MAVNKHFHTSGVAIITSEKTFMQIWLQRQYRFMVTMFSILTAHLLQRILSLVRILCLSSTLSQRLRCMWKTLVVDMLVKEN